MTEQDTSGSDWDQFVSNVQTSWNDFEWSEFIETWEPWKGWWAIPFYFGCYVFFWWILRTLQICKRSCCGTKCSTARYGEDSWAVVTGATDGIGKAAAFHLAKLGFNIVLISRTLSKLEATAKEIEETTEELGKKVETKIVSFDFSKSYSAEEYQTLYDEHLADLDISILINNVGMMAMGDFMEVDDQCVHNMITANCYSVVFMSQQIIKSFARRYEERGQRSLICNTSAMMSVSPVRSVATYPATKIFGDYITWGLAAELKKYKTDVCAWRAAHVNTKLIDGEDDVGCFGASPEKYVADAFSKCTSGIHSAYLPHEIAHMIMTNLKDLFGYAAPMWFFGKMVDSRKHVETYKNSVR